MAQLGDNFLTPNQRVSQGHDAAQWQNNPDLAIGLMLESGKYAGAVEYDSGVSRQFASSPLVSLAEVSGKNGMSCHFINMHVAVAMSAVSVYHVGVAAWATWLFPKA